MMKATKTLAAALLLAGVACTANAGLVLDSLGSGSEGNSRFNDTTPLGIDAVGNGFDPNAGNTFEDFDVSGSVSPVAAFNTSFSFSLSGMSNVDLTTGAKLADGGIDRAGNGDLGVRGGGNGMEALEGLLLGIDATNLSPTLSFQITGIGVAFLSGDEAGKVVNRVDTSKSLTFGASGTGSDVELSSGLIDVTPLDLIVSGGTDLSEVASVFGSDFTGGGNFRVTQFRVDVVAIPEPSGLLTMSLVPALLLRQPRRRR